MSDVCPLGELGGALPVKLSEIARQRHVLQHLHSVGDDGDVLLRAQGFPAPSPASVFVLQNAPSERREVEKRVFLVLGQGGVLQGSVRGK